MKTRERIHEAFNGLYSALASRNVEGPGDTGVLLRVANSLWSQEGLTFNRQFLDDLARNYGTGVRVADFGLAEIGEVDLLKLYRGRPIGTPGYIAPEMARGDGTVTTEEILPVDATEPGAGT